MRSGTLNVPGIVGFAKACEILRDEGAEESRRLGALRDRLHEALRGRVEAIELNGDLDRRVTANLNLSVAFVPGDALVRELSGVALSTGSACTSASVEPSYVLKAMGCDDTRAKSCIRFGIGRFNSEADIDRAADAVVDAIARVRASSPLWEQFRGSATVDKPADLLSAREKAE